MDTAASVGNEVAQTTTNDGYAIPINKAMSIAKQIESGNGSGTSTSVAPRSSASSPREQLRGFRRGDLGGRSRVAPQKLRASAPAT